MKNIIILLATIGFLIVSYGKIKNSSDVKVSFNNSGSSRRSENNRSQNSKKITKTIALAKNKAVVLDWQEATAEKIRAVFVQDSETAIATFRAESGLRASAQGWNCSYGVCSIEDRGKSISTDCGVAQLNFPGSVCPAESFNEDWNIQKAYEWKYLPNKKAGGTGFGPWVAHSTGRYLVFLKKQ